MQLKKWFENRMIESIGLQKYQAMKQGYELEISKETEKAYNFLVKTDFGQFYIWAPKSAVETFEERAASNRAAIDRYNYLLNLAKENGLKVRVGLKLSTIKEKLIEAGVQF